MAQNTDAAYYEQAALWDRSSFWKSRAQLERVEHATSLIPATVRTILDAGCGNGAFANAVRERYDVTALDISAEALAHVETKSVLASIHDMPLDDRAFDLVVCLEVLEHLPHETFLGALSELQRVTRDAILVSVPYRENLEHRMTRCPACRCRFHPNRHVRRFDASSLSRLFDDVEPVEIRTVGAVRRDRDLLYNRLMPAYRALRPLAPRAIDMCPQCGYAPRVSGTPASQPRLVAARRAILGALATSVPSWLMALYRRPTRAS
jgi:SAM-dependent methyltransferase